jgi:malate synthase
MSYPDTYLDALPPAAWPDPRPAWPDPLAGPPDSPAARPDPPDGRESSRSASLSPTRAATSRDAEILTPAALDFLTALHETFAGEIADLLAAREARQGTVARGADLDIDPATAAIRNDPSWRVVGAGPGLADRRVTLVGPVDERMALHALATDAQVWVADAEDSLSPTWENVIGAQLVLRDVVRGF